MQNSFCQAIDAKYCTTTLSSTCIQTPELQIFSYQAIYPTCIQETQLSNPFPLTFYPPNLINTHKNYTNSTILISNPHHSLTSDSSPSQTPFGEFEGTWVIRMKNLRVLTCSCLRTLRPLESLKVLGSSRMKILRVLTCPCLRTLRDIDLVVLANSMPYLDDLDISEPTNAFGEGVTDIRIEALSSKLKGLRRINVPSNHYVTNKSLLAPSKKQKKRKKSRFWLFPQTANT